MILNERIKERRMQLGMTLLDVANELGVKEATAQRYESGKIKNIKHETILRLSDVLHCSPAYLMGWEAHEEMTKKNDEQKLIDDYRSISSQGREYIRQQMVVAKKVFEKDSAVPNVEVSKMIY